MVKKRMRFLTVLFLLSLSACAPTVSLMRIDDPRIALISTSGRVVVVNFWATWCEPCAREIPVLNGLHKKFPDARIIGINLDDPENEGALPGFLKRHPIDYESFRRLGTSFDKASSSMDPDWNGGIPATFVFVEGKRVFSKMGELEAGELDKVLSSIL